MNGLYQVSNLGRVRSLKFGKLKIRNTYKDTNGYLQIDLWNNGKRKMFLIHRLVANAFLINQCNLPEVNHIDKNRANNNVNNLEYCDKSYNLLHRGITKRSSKIEQFDLQGNFIKEWGSVKDIKNKLHFSSNSIRACCNGKFKTSHNYIWKYKDVI